MGCGACPPGRSDCADFVTLDPGRRESQQAHAICYGERALVPTDSEGFPTCAAALANAPKLSGDRIIQVNRCMIDVPTCEEQMFTKDGKRLYSQARLRDWSGAVDVDLVAEAMLKLYGLESQEQVRDALRDNNLTAMLSRVNARGVLRSTDAGPKVLIGLI